MIEGFCLEVQPRDFLYIGDRNYSADLDNSYSNTGYHKYIVELGVDGLRNFNIRGIIGCKTHFTRAGINNVSVLYD